MRKIFYIISVLCLSMNGKASWHHLHKHACKSTAMTVDQFGKSTFHLFSAIHDKSQSGAKEKLEEKYLDYKDLVIFKEECESEYLSSFVDHHCLLDIEVILDGGLSDFITISGTVRDLTFLHAYDELVKESKKYNILAIDETSLDCYSSHY